MVAPAGLPQSGRQSVGVARPWCGRLGTVDHGHGAMSVGDVSSKGHTLVAQRLLLPKAGTKDTARLDTAGVPNASRAYRTRHPLALELWATNGAGGPPGWMSGDDERGRPYGLRRRRATWGERYGLAVPSHTAMRALDTAPPEYRGQGRRPRPPWPSVAAGRPSLGAEAWHSIDGRDGSQGPRVVEAVTRRRRSRPHRRQPGDAAMLGVLRDRDRDQQEGVQGDYSLSHATPETPVWAWARVAKAEPRMEECRPRSNSDAGVADDEGRHGTGWQQQQTLSFLAPWFLVRATARGKTWTPAMT